MDRFMQFAMVASNEAIADDLEVGDDGLGDRAGVYVGSGIGGIAERSMARRRWPRAV